MPNSERATQLAKELVGNVQFYETQERAMAPGIAGEWPEIIQAPQSTHGRLKKVLTGSLVAKLETAFTATRKEIIDAVIADVYTLVHPTELATPIGRHVQADCDKCRTALHVVELLRAKLTPAPEAEKEGTNG